jgi:hypothetical protein
MLPLISIYLGGVITLLLVAFHTRFYKTFNWADEFSKLTLSNRRIIYTIHVALLLLLFMLGAVSLIFADELSQCRGLAFGFNFLFSVFWFWRLVWQRTYFRRHKGQKLSPVGICLTAVFLLLAAAYIMPVVFRFL